MQTLLFHFFLFLERMLFRKSVYGVVLMYHKIENNSSPHSVAEVHEPPLRDKFSISIQDLKSQVTNLKSRGFRFIFAEDIPSWTKKAGKVCALTFDDGYINNEALKKLDVPVTIFMTTNPREEEIDAPPEAFHPERLIRTLKDSPHIHFGLHGITHRRWTRVPLEDAQMEIAQSKQTIESLWGKVVTSAAYPKGSHNRDIVELVSTEVDCAFLADGGPILSRPKNHYTIPRIGIFNHTPECEFELRTSRIFTYLLSLRSFWKTLRRK